MVRHLILKSISHPCFPSIFVWSVVSVLVVDLVAPSAATPGDGKGAGAGAGAGVWAVLAAVLAAVIVVAALLGLALSDQQRLRQRLDTLEEEVLVLRELVQEVRHSTN